MELLKSKTVWGGILIAIGQVAVMFPPLAPYAAVFNALGVVLGGVGVKSAISASK